MAAHVRTTHVHVVIAAKERPERILHDMKAYATRALNQAGLDDGDIRRWPRHGSTRYLWQDEAVESAINYVIRRQGEPMALGGSRSRTVLGTDQ
jgi:hypothetical protein